MKILTEEDKKNFLEWSEGNKYLYELLCTCWENEITTFASCGGHENGNDFPYIGIIVNDKSIPYIKSILGQLQKMQNIAISTSARGRNPICEDNELRGIVFSAHNYNCCEMFYKMQKGIKELKKEIELSPRVSAFYESVKRFNLTSRDEIQQMIEDGMVEGATFSTPTQDYIEFQESKSLVKNNKIIRFIKKILSFTKGGSQNYDILQKKYGFLQREYHEEKNSKMDQYRIENFNSEVHNQHGFAPRKVISVRTPINEDITVEEER